MQEFPYEKSPIGLYGKAQPLMPYHLHLPLMSGKHNKIRIINVVQGEKHNTKSLAHC